LTENDPKKYFNPYTKLVHDVLKSSAYAFSIDDNLAFHSLKADGIIITIGGLKGLQNTDATPIPDKASTIKLACKGAK
jgi:hypothetical protein